MLHCTAGPYCTVRAALSNFNFKRGCVKRVSVCVFVHRA